MLLFSFLKRFKNNHIKQERVNPCNLIIQSFCIPPTCAFVGATMWRQIYSEFKQTGYWKPTNIPLIAINRQHMSPSAIHRLLGVLSPKSGKICKTFQRINLNLQGKILRRDGECFIHKPFYLFGKYSLMICCKI